MITAHFPKPTDTFFRFLLIGLVNTLVGLSSIFLLLHAVGLSYWLSTFLGNAIGATVSYVLNRQFTFSSKVSAGRSIPLFVVVILGSYFLAFSISKMAADWVLTEYTNGFAVLLGTVLYTIMNYLGQKYIVFPHKKAL
ncbi:GtrA family protein [Bacillus sp. REN16]|uniref:GtrA family protein n=1 Tax=Bacillus sp. REN16 TaxID=2887296 RepID=UPI001E5E0BF3|nr:GtrA family protein [Bacillus sp. REN16]MCC3355815.1 GtrA family protein [Bacillus sp. REN16]